MKMTGKKTFILALVGVIGLSVATPARADWYDRHHHWHHGYPPAGWVYNARLGYYSPPVVVAAPPPVYVAEPPPPVVITQPPQVVYAQPYYAPAPPVGVSLGVHIR